MSALLDEQQIWRTLKEKKAFLRQERERDIEKRKEQRTDADFIRFGERRPNFRRSAFKTLRHDEERYNRLLKRQGLLRCSEDEAKQKYHEEIGETETFWWEASFDHSRYLTHRQRERLKRKQREAEMKYERETRQRFENMIPQRWPDNNLAEAAIQADLYNKHKALLKELEEEAMEMELCNDSIEIAWAQCLPLGIVEKLLQWDTCEKDAVPEAEPQEQVSNWPISDSDDSEEGW